MGMQVGSGGSGDPDVMVDINTTPLIDVMLVLLIMLIITIPIQTHAVKLNMPVGNPPPPTVPPEVILVEVDFDGTVIWNHARREVHQRGGAARAAGVPPAAEQDRELQARRGRDGLGAEPRHHEDRPRRGRAVRRLTKPAPGPRGPTRGPGHFRNQENRR